MTYLKVKQKWLFYVVFVFFSFLTPVFNTNQVSAKCTLTTEAEDIVWESSIKENSNTKRFTGNNAKADCEAYETRMNRKCQPQEGDSYAWNNVQYSSKNECEAARTSILNPAKANGDCVPAGDAAIYFLIKNGKSLGGPYTEPTCTQSSLAPGGSETSEARVSTEGCDGLDGVNMKWILCPALDGMTDTVGGLDSILENALEVNTKLYSAGSSTQTAWTSFRDIANIIMVIMFLFVIFSQITGYGIDNYGIKKILPRLIVMAILVNLSFLVCQIAVDLSNIFGHGLNTMFRSVGGAMESKHGVAGFTSTVVGAALGAAGVAGAASGGLTVVLGAGITAAAPLIIGTLLIALLGALIAIMIFYAMIGVRELMVIGCLLIAPVAFASYVLPNTQWFFKKWWNIFKTSLIIYPICGAVFGLSALLKSILLSQDEVQFWLLIIMFFAPFLPFVFLPTLLMSAINTLGAIGGAITAMGRGARNAGRNAQNALQNSGRMKNAQERAQTASEMARQAKRANWQFDRRTGTVRTDANGIPIERRQGRFSRVLSPIAERERDAARAKLTQTMNADAMNATYSEDGVVAAEVMKGKNAATEHIAEGRAGVAEVQQMNAVTRAYNKRVTTEAEEAAGVSQIRPSVANTIATNARLTADADQQVGVAPINSQLAHSRAQSRLDAQNYKAYQDQFAGFSKADLAAEANNVNSWLNNSDGNQRLSALIEAMEANGQQKDIYQMLRNTPGVAGNAAIASTLAKSNDKVLRAYGKHGGNNDFATFMSGTGTNTLSSYINDKQADFLNGIDDKALTEIANNAPNAMSTDLLVEAASRMNDTSSLNAINQMLASRNDISNISGKQLSSMKESTLNTIKTNATARTAILNASNDLAKNPELVNRLQTNERRVINNIRASAGPGQQPI